MHRNLPCFLRVYDLCRSPLVFYPLLLLHKVWHHGWGLTWYETPLSADNAPLFPRPPVFYHISIWWATDYDALIKVVCVWFAYMWTVRLMTGITRCLVSEVGRGLGACGKQCTTGSTSMLSGDSTKCACLLPRRAGRCDFVPFSMGVLETLEVATPSHWRGRSTSDR